MSDATIEVVVDKHSNLLLLGKGRTNYSLKEISYETSYDEVLERYGESDLSKAFKIAKDMGVEHIFMMNLKNSYDYFDISEVLKQGDFTYIVPVSVYMSDVFTDSYQGGKFVSYIAYLLSLVSVNKNESVIIATDKHASLYEDLDAFIEDMGTAESLFRKSCGSGMNLENIIFIGNNSEKNDMAHVMLASALCVEDIPDYPTGNFGKAIFDIDSFDNPGNWAYFKNHSDAATTVENLLNFLPKGSEKIVTVSRILKMIKREIDFSEFCGKSYSEYQRMRIERKLDLYLSGLKDYVIYKYEIHSVQGFKDIYNKGTILVKNVFDVWPVNCLTSCHIEEGIEI